VFPMRIVEHSNSLSANHCTGLTTAGVHSSLGLPTHRRMSSVVDSLLLNAAGNFLSYVSKLKLLHLRVTNSVNLVLRMPIGRMTT
jgi:hypothetical protein